jgi:hypothetical protein
VVDLPAAAIPTTCRLCVDAARSRVSSLRDASQSLDALDMRVTNAGGPEYLSKGEILSVARLRDPRA